MIYGKPAARCDRRSSKVALTTLQVVSPEDPELEGHREDRRKRVTAWLLAIALIVGATGSGAQARGACVLVANTQDPSQRTLTCGDALTVRPAPGARYRPIFTKGQALPSAVRLDGGALLIEFHPNAAIRDFQILTPLAIAAVRGTKWAMEVVPARTSTLTLEGAVAVTNRRLNQYVVLTPGQGVDISPSDTTMVQKQWGEARVRALLARFGE